MTPVTVEKIKELALIPVNFYITLVRPNDTVFKKEVATRHSEEEIKSWIENKFFCSLVEEGIEKEYAVTGYRSGEGNVETSNISPVLPFNQNLLFMTDGRHEYGPVEPTAAYSLSIKTPDRYLSRMPAMETFDKKRVKKLDWKKGSVEVFTGSQGNYFIMESFDSVLVEVKESFIIPDSMDAFIVTNPEYSVGGITIGIKKLSRGYVNGIKVSLTNKGSGRAVVYMDEPVLDIIFVEKAEYA